MLLQQGWGLEGGIKRGETRLFAAVRVTDAQVEGLHHTYQGTAPQLYCLQIIKLLLDAGANTEATQQPDDHHLPIMLNTTVAPYCHTTVLLTTLLPHDCTPYNCTALQLYCLQIMKMLIDAGANIEATLQPGEHPDRPVSFAATPLAVAAMYGKLEAMQVLLGELNRTAVAVAAAAADVAGALMQRWSERPCGLHRMSNVAR
jgi:hypothetical protein